MEEVFRRLDEGNAKPKQGVFYNGQVYDAYTFVSDRSLNLVYTRK